MKNKRIVWLLLRRNISAGQIAGYALANFIGLAIVLCAIQFYRDISAAWDSDGDSYITRDYMIISKEVSSLNTLGFGASNGRFYRDIGGFPAYGYVADVRAGYRTEHKRVYLFGP